MKEWGEAVAKLLGLIERIADHAEKRRAAYREAVRQKADIDKRHVEQRDLSKDPRSRP